MKQYQDLISKILTQGTAKSDRTGTGTLSLFGETLRFDLNEGFPIVSIKSTHFRSVVHELLWFLQGDTNTQYLNDNGVTIWDEWATSSGDLGPVYGKQWRAWKTSEGGSIDQIKQTIKNIKTKPDSRRHIVSAWNVEFLPDESRPPQTNVLEGRMALAPCHVLFQFYVSEGKLSCLVYQRSCDVFLGLPFNIASYALLTHMIAQQCDLGVGDLIWVGGDVHLYSNHVKEAQVLLYREPKPLPTLALTRAENLFCYRGSYVMLKGYDPHPAIRAKVAV